MRIINVINLKGGVGKTMTSLQMGHILHYKYGKSVLLVDNDKQGNLSRAMGVYTYGGRCGADQILSGADPNTIKMYTDVPGLGVVSANMSLLTAAYRLTAGIGEDATARFETLRHARAEDGEPYDYIIIDNPPDLGLNVINALMVSDDVIVPTRIDQWALDGLEIIQDQINGIQKYRKRTMFTGILVTMYRNNAVNTSGVEWLSEHGYNVFKEKIRYSDKAAESTLMGKNLEEYSPRSAAAVSYRKFVKEYRRRVKSYERNRNMLQR